MCFVCASVRDACCLVWFVIRPLCVAGARYFSPPCSWQNHFIRSLVPAFPYVYCRYVCDYSKGGQQPPRVREFLRYLHVARRIPADRLHGGGLSSAVGSCQSATGVGDERELSRAIVSSLKMARLRGAKGVVVSCRMLPGMVRGEGRGGAILRC